MGRSNGAQLHSGLFTFKIRDEKVWDDLTVRPTSEGAYEGVIEIVNEHRREQIKSALRWQSVIVSESTYQLRFAIGGATTVDAMRQACSIMRGFDLLRAYYFFEVAGDETLELAIVEPLPPSSEILLSVTGEHPAYEELAANLSSTIAALMATGLCSSVVWNPDARAGFDIQLNPGTGLSRAEHIRTIAQAFPL